MGTAPTVPCSSRLKEFPEDSVDPATPPRLFHLFGAGASNPGVDSFWSTIRFDFFSSTR